MPSSPLAPTPRFDENESAIYEREMAPNRAGQRGPLRFEEGIPTDTDVPDDFQEGMSDGYIPAPGRPNHNRNVYEKPAEQTMAERAHVGSASWIEAPTFLGEFAHGANNDYAAQTYEEVIRGENTRFERSNPARVDD